MSRAAPVEVNNAVDRVSNMATAPDIGPFRHTLVGRFAGHTVEHPEAVCAETWDDTGARLSRLTFSEGLTWIGRVAAAVSTVASRQAPVGIVMPPGPEALVAQLAVQAAGGVFVPLDPRSTSEEFARNAQRAGCTAFLVATGTSADAMSTLRRELGLPAIDVNSVPDGAWPRLRDELSPDERAAIIFTSGSTAAAKGAAFVHGALTGAADETIGMKRLGADDRLLSNMPMHHVAANVSFTWPAVSLGIPIVFAPFTASRFFEVAAATGVTYGGINATHMRMIRAKGAAAVAHRMRRAGTGFPMTRELLESFEHTYGIELLNGYGMTEMLGHVSSQRYGEARGVGSSGTAIGGRRVRVADECGRDCAPGETGEILVTWSSPYEVMTGYVGDPEGTDAALGSGELATGDLGYMSAESELWIVGRAKDLIKYGGISVSPAEIEGVLSEDKAVNDVAVVGLPDDIYGEVVVAAVETEIPAPPGLEEPASRPVPSPAERVQGAEADRGASRAAATANRQDRQTDAPRAVGLAVTGCLVATGDDELQVRSVCPFG